MWSSDIFHIFLQFLNKLFDYLNDFEIEIFIWKKNVNWFLKFAEIRHLNFPLFYRKISPYLDVYLARYST